LGCGYSGKILLFPWRQQILAPENIKPEVGIAYGPSRVSELQALDLQYRLYHPEGVMFTIPTLGKRRTVGASPKQVMFGAFPRNDCLCVVKCLRQYEAVTHQYRDKDLDKQAPWSSV